MQTLRLRTAPGECPSWSWQRSWWSMGQTRLPRIGAGLHAPHRAARGSPHAGGRIVVCTCCTARVPVCSLRAARTQARLTLRRRYGTAPLFHAIMAQEEEAALWLLE